MAKGFKKHRGKKLIAAANMPPLYHTLPGEPFDYRKSEVLNWLSERPALIDYLFDRARESGEIIYDKETGKWQGVEWEED